MKLALVIVCAIVWVHIALLGNKMWRESHFVPIEWSTDLELNRQLAADCRRTYGREHFCDPPPWAR